MEGVTRLIACVCVWGGHLHKAQFPILSNLHLPGLGLLSGAVQLVDTAPSS